jgi:hypothetical protein
MTLQAKSKVVTVMEIKAKIQSVDTSKNTTEASNQQSSTLSTPARVNLGIGTVIDKLEAAKASPLDSLFAPAKSKNQGLSEEVAEIGKAVSAAKAAQDKLEGIAEKLKYQAQFISPMIKHAITNSGQANEGTEKAKSSLNEISKKLAKTDESIVGNLK